MLQFMIDTLIRTANLSLIALGLSLVYGLIKFPNIAYVQYAMVGAFVTAALLDIGLPFWVAILLACLACGLLTIVLHQVVFRQLIKVGSANAMIGSLAVSMVLIALCLGIAGSSPIIYNLPISPIIEIAGIRISTDQLWTFIVTALLLVGFALLLFKTALGRSIRVLACNKELAAASGINADKMIHIANLLSGAMAALGGSLLAMNSSAYINQGNNLLLPVLASAILGGLGNPFGAVFGALVIATTETIVTNVNFGWLIGKHFAFIPVTYINAASFLVLIIALLWRPYGLFNREVHRV
ncbi:branched-chain amino acid ABC transporter permease [Celerinatantimonas yamalensis]|uniref:Branched-chain amino acid ABC transporter permease n=1 Tax=Celerinatantimonas yamalensis TaxID=559956 RepID=A0ABW9G8Z1_9GAMM